MKRFFLTLGLLSAWFCSASKICLADGFIVIQSPPERVVPGHFAFAPLQVTYHHVTVDINDQVATTTVEQEFYNPNSQVLEGTYLFPLPAGSHIDKFSMDINGTMMDAELLQADKARAIYEEIVRKFRDPALLEYMGRDAFKVRIFPINGNSAKKVKLTYTQLLKSDTGLVEYVYPMNTEKFSSRPLNDVSVKVTLACQDPIKSIYSPTNNVEIRRDGDNRAVVGWEAKNFRPDTDFKLIFSRSKQAVGVDLLTYRQGSDDGYFMLLASPGLEAAKGVVEKKDVCFVLDTSGSMAGPKIEQAKKALSFCLNNLDETDHFEVIRFSTECEPLFSELRPATKENVTKALDFVRGLKAIGGTAIDDALHQSLGMKHEADRPYEIVFLTDGEPTIGETNEDVLVSQASKQSAGTRIFCFGIGNDVNTHLLDRIAADTKAFSTYVAPEEDIEVKVSNFYTKIKEPVLSNVQLAFTGDNIHVSQMYPGVMPDLFKGEMLVAFGRYSGHGASAVKISGTINGEKQTFATDVHFTEQDMSNGYIPRLWAVRRVGYLLDQIRMHGESKELKDEVTRLAREHGIVTPYTAYLIVEDEKTRGVPLTLQNMREFGNDARAVKDSEQRLKQAYSEAAAPQARTGEKAVAAARDVDALKRNENLDQLAQAGQQQDLDKGADRSTFAGAQAPAADAGNGPVARFGPLPAPTTQPAEGYRVAHNYGQQARVVNGRAFYQNGDTWTDSTAQDRKDLKQQKIAFNSDEYFALLKKHPEAAQWFALGNEVDVVLDETLYIVR
ncbi:MAG TPA: VIT and VWA domain-containing protein [Tepidisphaeraceae bacterium]|jgi:Ca-activated chloride channel family protein|nr:VIT and VWA domain-containing protein [Tepidisphaeraceae bacterium]